MRPSPRRSPRAAVLALVLACPLLLTGCPAMSSPDRTSEPVAEKANWDWPLRFKEHSVGVACYDTIGCRARYANVWQAYDAPDERRPASASIKPDYREFLTAGHIGIRNFPAPMELSWRSKDGAQHEARIDIGEIFKDERVRHNVPRDAIPPDVTSLAVDAMSPGIIVEVNDRTVRVYMRARIPLKYERIPGNRYSDHVSELIEIETRTF